MSCTSIAPDIRTTIFTQPYFRCEWRSSDRRIKLSAASAPTTRTKTATQSVDEFTGFRCASTAATIDRIPASDSRNRPSRQYLVRRCMSLMQRCKLVTQSGHLCQSDKNVNERRRYEGPDAWRNRRSGRRGFFSAHSSLEGLCARGHLSTSPSSTVTLDKHLSTRVYDTDPYPTKTSYCSI